MLNITDGLDKGFTQGNKAGEFFEFIKELNNYGGIVAYDYTRFGWSDKQQELKDYLEQCNYFGYPFTAWGNFRASNVYPSLRDFITDTYPIVVNAVITYVDKEGFKDLIGLSDDDTKEVISKVSLSRISRAYISFLQEEYAILKTLDFVPNIKIYSSTLIDKHFGIDYIVVGIDEEDELQTFNVHVLKDSDSSKYHYGRKSKMNNYPIKVKTNTGVLEQVHIKRTFSNDLEHYYPAYQSSVVGKETISTGDLHLPADYYSNGVRQNRISDIIVMELLLDGNKHERFEESTLKKIKDLVKDLDLAVHIDKVTNI